jgi:hypothetical protein
VSSPCCRQRETIQEGTAFQEERSPGYQSLPNDVPLLSNSRTGLVRLLGCPRQTPPKRYKGLSLSPFQLQGNGDRVRGAAVNPSYTVFTFGSVSGNRHQKREARSAPRMLCP